MALAESFRQQVALLLQTIPFVAMESCFALKGRVLILAGDHYNARCARRGLVI